MQVPFAALIASENQEALAREARSCWGMPFVEDSNNIRASIPTLIDRLPSVWDFGSQVDGRGVERVADAMEA
jgi:hypothetical protein